MKTVSTEIRNLASKTRQELSLDGWAIAGGKLIQGNQSVKIMRGLMRLRKAKEVFAYLLAYTESDIDLLARCLAIDPYTWELKTVDNVSRAYATQFAYAHSLLIDQSGDADQTLFNIATFSNRVRSCMTPDPSYTGYADDAPMIGAVRAYRTLESFDSSITQFYDEPMMESHGDEVIKVRSNVALRRCNDTGSFTLFRFLTWDNGTRIYVDKVYHNGQHSDLVEFQEFINARFDENRTVYFREHNHLIDSDDADGVGFKKLGSNYTVHPTFDVNMANIDQLPYMDSFRYFDTVRGVATFRCEPDDSSCYAADSCSGGWNEYCHMELSECGCCGCRYPHEDLLPTGLESVAPSGYACEQCYSERVGCCDGCGEDFDLEYDEHIRLERTHEYYAECCYTRSN